VAHRVGLFVVFIQITRFLAGVLAQGVAALLDETIGLGGLHGTALHIILY
jgi:hypothetical protein